MNLPHARRARLLARAHLHAAAFFLVAPALAFTPPAPAAQETAAAPQRRTLHVTVMDKQGRFAGGLEREAFTVYDRGKPRPVVSLEASDAPVSIGIVIDSSASMKSRLKRKDSQGLSRLGKAVAAFLEKGRAENEYFVIGFNQSPQLILDRTRDRAAVLGALDALTSDTAQGRTALYDSCVLALDKVSYGAHARRAVLLISDGVDTASRYTFADLRRRLMEQDVTLYAIGVTEGPYDLSMLDVVGRAILEELAGVSGGRVAVPEDDKQLVFAAENLAVELRWQYALGVEFAPSTKKDGWHEVEVKVASQPDRVKKKSVKLYARTRRGFYDSPRGVKTEARPE